MLRLSRADCAAQPASLPSNGDKQALQMGCHDPSAHRRKLSRRPGCLNNALRNRVVVQQGCLAALRDINAIHVPAQQEERNAAA